MITEQIKEIVKNYINYMNLSDIVFGTMVTPTKVAVDKGRQLEAPFLIIPEHLTKYTIKQRVIKPEPGTTIEVEIDNSLKVGDKVVLAKTLGGQRYIIIDRYKGE